jgi:methylenetetrahydrofolate reductase (NADPH)
MLTEQDGDEAATTSREGIVAFMSGCSIEATRPSPVDASLLRDLLRPRTPVFIAAPPGQKPKDTVEYAKVVSRVGLSPTPHLAARSFPSIAACDELVQRLAGEAGVTSVMLVGGDIAKPVGALQNALQVLESGVLSRGGVLSVGIAGYPERHPRIEDDELEAALVTKLASAQSQGLNAFVVTQFSFDEDVAANYVRSMRERGLRTQVRVGLAGPTSITSWLGYAKRCGVKASASALARRTGLVGHLFKMLTPDPVICRFAQAAESGDFADVEAHLFSFGGVVETARWLNAVQRGRLSLEDGRGFRVSTD